MSNFYLYKEFTDLQPTTVSISVTNEYVLENIRVREALPPSFVLHYPYVDVQSIQISATVSGGYPLVSGSDYLINHIGNKIEIQPLSMWDMPSPSPIYASYSCYRTFINHSNIENIYKDNRYLYALMNNGVYVYDIDNLSLHAWIDDPGIIYYSAFFDGSRTWFATSSGVSFVYRNELEGQCYATLAYSNFTQVATSLPVYDISWSNDIIAVGNASYCDIISGTTFTRLGLGFSGYNQCVCFPSVGSLPTSFTVEFWMNPRIFNPPDYAINQIRISGTGGFHFTTYSGGGVYCGTNAATRFTPTDLPAGTMSLNTWQHIAFTFSGAGGPSGTACFYKNGVLSGTKSMDVPISWDRFMLGWPVLPYSINGTIYDVRVWDVPRTQQEVQDNMSVSLSGTEFGLRAYWPLDRNTGNIVKDSTPSGYDGYFATTSQTLEPLSPPWPHKTFVPFWTVISSTGQRSRYSGAATSVHITESSLYQSIYDQGLLYFNPIPTGATYASGTARHIFNTSSTPSITSTFINGRAMAVVHGSSPLGGDTVFLGHSGGLDIISINDSNPSGSSVVNKHSYNNPTYFWIPDTIVSAMYGKDPSTGSTVVSATGLTNYVSYSYLVNHEGYLTVIGYSSTARVRRYPTTGGASYWESNFDAYLAYITVITQDIYGNYYIGGRDNSATSEYHIIKVAPDCNTVLLDVDISDYSFICLQVSNNNNYIVALDTNGGVFILDTSNFTAIYASTGSSLTRLTVDFNGDIWALGTFSGRTVYRCDINMTSIATDTFDVPLSMYGILTDPEGFIWVIGEDSSTGRTYLSRINPHYSGISYDFKNAYVTGMYQPRVGGFTYDNTGALCLWVTGQDGVPNYYLKKVSRWGAQLSSMSIPAAQCQYLYTRDISGSMLQSVHRRGKYFSEFFAGISDNVVFISPSYNAASGTGSVVVATSSYLLGRSGLTEIDLTTMSSINFHEYINIPRGVFR